MQSALHCRLCTPGAPGDSAICAECERTYGPRVARLLARAERDQDFAAACLRNLPPPLRERFASLLGQRFSPMEAAVLGVYLHGLAGDLAAAARGEASLIAGDIIEFLPEAIRRHQGAP